MPVLAPELVEEKQQGHGHIAPPKEPGEDSGDSGGSGGGPSGSGFPLTKAQVGMWLLVTVVVMLFAGISSALVVLRGFPSWQSIAIPRLVWVNTFILLASSVSMELARSAARKGIQSAITRWVGVTTLLGLGFLAGQIVVWRQLVAAGVYLPSTIHSSFFYVMTGLHGVHILGGLAGLGIVLSGAIRRQFTPASHEPLKVCSLYWHFMDGIWVYLFLLLILV